MCVKVFRVPKLISANVINIDARHSEVNAVKIVYGWVSGGPI